MVAGVQRVRGRVDYRVGMGVDGDESDQRRSVGHDRSCFNSLIAEHFLTSLHFFQKQSVVMTA